MILVQEAGASRRSGRLLQSTSPPSARRRTMPLRALTVGAESVTAAGAAAERAGGAEAAGDVRGAARTAAATTTTATTSAAVSENAPGERGERRRRLPCGLSSITRV